MEFWFGPLHLYISSLLIYFGVVSSLLPPFDQKKKRKKRRLKKRIQLPISDHLMRIAYVDFFLMNKGPTCSNFDHF
jgi:hypothetical protein